MKKIILKKCLKIASGGERCISPSGSAPAPHDVAVAKTIATFSSYNLLIVVEPHRSPCALLANDLANQNAGEQSWSKVEIFYAIIPK